MRKSILIAACILSGVVVAQKKNVNEALSQAKSEKPDFKLAESKLAEAFANDETKNDPRTFFVAGELQMKKFENERLYFQIQQAEKAKKDVMFPALLSGYEYYKQAYDLYSKQLKAFEEAKANKVKGVSKPKDYTKDMLAKYGRDYRDFLIEGGVYYNDKKEYMTAYKYFDEYASAVNNPMLEKLEPKINPKDSTLLLIKYYTAVMAHQAENNKLAIEKYSAMKDDNYNSLEIYQKLHGLYSLEKDSVNMVAILNEGVKKFPQENYFILNLINVYLGKGQFSEAMNYLDDAIKLDPKNPQLYSVKAAVYEEQKNTEMALATYQKALEVAPESAEANYNIGRMYFNEAQSKLDEISKITDNKKFQAEKDKNNALFEKAIPYFEKALQLDQSNRQYMVPLRNIYYKLNRSNDYQRISKLMGE